MSILNISAYRFIPLDDVPSLHAQCRDFCRAKALKGSIMLSKEGINLMLAGEAAVIAEFKAFLETFTPFKAMIYKESLSQSVPFKRMLVKIKEALTPFNVPIQVHEEEGHHMPAQQLKEWLDTAKDFTLLDVRNDYEIEYGTFNKATSLNLKHFRDFTAAIESLPEEAKSRPMVTCCTGGIRCEKIVPFLRQQGFQEVYQLEGGILQYFHDCGDVHFDGACYVFDERVAIKKVDTL